MEKTTFIITYIRTIKSESKTYYTLKNVSRSYAEKWAASQVGPDETYTIEIA